MSKKKLTGDGRNLKYSPASKLDKNTKLQKLIAANAKMKTTLNKPLKEKKMIKDGCQRKNWNVQRNAMMRTECNLKKMLLTWDASRARSKNKRRKDAMERLKSMREHWKMLKRLEKISAKRELILTKLKNRIDWPKNSREHKKNLKELTERGQKPMKNKSWGSLLKLNYMLLRRRMMLVKHMTKKEMQEMLLINVNDRRKKRIDCLLKRELLKKLKPPDLSNRRFNGRRKHSRGPKTRQRMVKRKRASRMNSLSRSLNAQKLKKKFARRPKLKQDSMLRWMLSVKPKGKDHNKTRSREMPKIWIDCNNNSAKKIAIITNQILLSCPKPSKARLKLIKNYTKTSSISENPQCRCLQTTRSAISTFKISLETLTATRRAILLCFRMKKVISRIRLAGLQMNVVIYETLTAGISSKTSKARECLAAPTLMSVEKSLHLSA